MMHKPYILAHDTGTGGDKAVLTDLRGRIVDSAYQAYGLSYPRPDWAEQDPDCATSRMRSSRCGRSSRARDVIRDG